MWLEPGTSAPPPPPSCMLWPFSVPELGTTHPTLEGILWNLGAVQTVGQGSQRPDEEVHEASIFGLPLGPEAAKPQIELPLQRPVCLVSYTAPRNVTDQKTSPLLSTSPPPPHRQTHTHTP